MTQDLLAHFVPNYLSLKEVCLFTKELFISHLKGKATFAKVKFEMVKQMRQFSQNFYPYKFARGDLSPSTTEMLTKRDMTHSNHLNVEGLDIFHFLNFIWRAMIPPV